jgi:hypothetical protein
MYIYIIYTDIYIVTYIYIHTYIYLLTRCTYIHMDVYICIYMYVLYIHLYVYIPADEVHKALQDVGAIEMAVVASVFVLLY